MTGLLIAATKFEIEHCRKALSKNSDWHCVITGIGGVATAYAVTKAIEKYKPDMMIQVGIAGALDEEIILGNVVAVGSECFGDLGVIENKKRKTIFDLNLQPHNQKPFKNARLVNANKKLLKQTLLPVIDAVTVNEITTRKDDINFYKNELNTAIESMEGAAFHYAALMEKIPFIQIRSISNYVGERNKKKWKIQLAIDNLNTKVMEVISEIKFLRRGIKEAL